MLRPATPLTVVLLAAFVLLLLSVLTVPITKALYLGQAGDVKFGVFGYCNGEKCSSVGIGYDTDELFKGQKTSFQLPQGVRKTLSSVLIIHVVAAALSLVMVILAGVSHTHGAAHSSRYLLLMFVLMVITFVVCVVSFVVDILLFIPHLAFGSYFTIVAAVLLGIGAVVSCIMRRTVVGRKARRKKIAENAEMSGENYYNREYQKPVATFNAHSTVPSISGANGTASDSLPAFASFENRKKEDQVSDERIPLTQINTDRSQGSNPSEVNAYGVQRSESRDEYGNRIRPNHPYASQGRPSLDRGRGGADPYRGGHRTPRGGYGRGGYDGYGGPMRGRGGGPGPRGRGGYGPPRGGRGGYGPPRGGGYGRGGSAMAMGAAYGGPPSTDPYDPYAQQRPGADRAQNWATGSNASASNLNTAYQGHDADGGALPRAESPPPLPDAASDHQGGYGNMGTTQDTNQYGQFSQSRGDVAELPPPRRDGYMSDGSKYSTDDYVPPRASWNQAGRNSPRGQSRGQSPASHMQRSPPPLEREGSITGMRQPPVMGQPPVSGGYYDHQSARYDASQQPPPPPPPQQQQHLTAGEPYYEDVHGNIDGSRSPAESERSTFTSISQRGVNPRWNPNQNRPPMPPPGMPSQTMPPQGVPARRAVQQRHDMILDNPDFQMPGGGRSGRRNNSLTGLVPGSAYPT